ncbi:MAG TPA: acyl-CoA reductase [Flavobacteriales bacterium]|nr:acyl-CoA reductase [Flavobacteriales bacterium]
MTGNERIAAFVQLGHFLEHFAVEKDWQGYEDGVSKAEHDDFNKAIMSVQHHNGWFTPEMVRKAFAGISKWLKADVLSNWLAKYPGTEKNKTIAVIMAGNIPLVGFHDVLCVLLSGNKLMAKFSGDDDVLMPLLLKYLVQVEPGFNDYIRISNNQLANFNAVIATGSNNSARYFEAYFGKYPHIIRKNRTSVAVIQGNESAAALKALGHDVFDYYGLGCRNVTKIYVPKGYNLDHFFGAIFDFKDIVHHKKYANNYDYHKAIYLMNGDKLVENGFLLLKEDKSFFSPVGVLHYEYYDDLHAVEKELAENRDALQCVVDNKNILFGQTQQPKIDDYADGVDTMQWIQGL